jgi:hypothetical protein
MLLHQLLLHCCWGTRPATLTDVAPQAVLAGVVVLLMLLRKAVQVGL